LPGLFYGKIIPGNIGLFNRWNIPLLLMVALTLINYVFIRQQVKFGTKTGTNIAY